MAGDDNLNQDDIEKLLSGGGGDADHRCTEIVEMYRALLPDCDWSFLRRRGSVWSFGCLGFTIATPSASMANTCALIGISLRYWVVSLLYWVVYLHFPPSNPMVIPPQSSCGASAKIAFSALCVSVWPSKKVATREKLAAVCANTMFPSPCCLDGIF